MAYEKEIRNISSTLTENIVKAGKKMIAVVDFTDLQGNVTELGRFLAEEFSVAFAGAGKGFEVVDRTHLKSILAEHKLSATGIIDPQTARKLGQLVGVDALITGTITPFGDSVRVSVKILDTATAKVIGASSGDIAKTKAIEELLARGIQAGVPSTPATPIPPSAPPAVGKAVEAEGFIFKPVKCSRSGGKMICTISFQNNGSEDRRLEVTGRGWSSDTSHLYDNLGNQYPVSIQIGREEPRDSIVQKFIPQLPVNVHFIAEDVRPEATHITVSIRIRDFKKLVAVRNIPIIK
jgi:TolB-like protein